MIIIDSHTDIEKKIVEAIRKKVKESGDPKKFTKTAVELYKKIVERVRIAILSSNEFESLKSGKLRMDFGLDDGIVAQLPSILSELIEVYYEDLDITDPQVALSVRFVVRARSEDDPYVQSAFSQAHYTSEKSGEVIQWLNWLLFSGSDIINETYKVYPIDNKGRSGMGIMITGNNFAFKVDGEFSGIAGNNMVTRAISSAKDDILAIIRSYQLVTK